THCTRVCLHHPLPSSSTSDRRGICIGSRIERSLPLGGDECARGDCSARPVAAPHQKDPCSGNTDLLARDSVLHTAFRGHTPWPARGTLDVAVRRRDVLDLRETRNRRCPG